MSTDAIILKVTDGVTVVKTTDTLVTAVGSTVAGPVGPAGAVAKVVAINNNPASVTIDAVAYNVAHITGQSQALSIDASGTPSDGATLRVSITGTTGIPLSWSSKFESSLAPLPATTLGSARLDVGFFWNTEASKWRCVAAV